jgi:hypothetical protein
MSWCLSLVSDWDLNTPLPWRRGEVLVPILLGFIFTPFLMITGRLVIKERIELGDALKASVAAAVATFFIDVGLRYLLEPDSVGFWATSSGIAFVAWSLALLLLVGLEFRHALPIAAIFTVMRIPLNILILELIINGVFKR